MLVLFRQPAAVRLHRPPQFQRLANHRRHDPIELQRALIVAIGFEGQRDFQRAPGAAPDRDRHGDKGQLASGPRAVASRRRQYRFLAHARYDDRFAGVQHSAGDGFLRTPTAARAGQTVAQHGLGMQLAAVGILEKHAGADDLVAPFEDLEHGLQRRLEVQYAGERLADFEQRREAADLVGAVFFAAHTCVSHPDETNNIVGDGAGKRGQSLFRKKGTVPYFAA